jgi:hypothetical protein
MSDDGRTLDEHRLRTSLRLEVDEVPARFDPALIAAAARAAEHRSSDLVPAVALAFVGGWIASEIWRVAIGTAAGLIGADALDLAVRAITAAAPVVAPLVAVVAGSVAPLGLTLAALAVIAFQQRRAENA